MVDPSGSLSPLSPLSALSDSPKRLYSRVVSPEPVVEQLVRTTAFPGRRPSGAAPEGPVPMPTPREPGWVDGGNMRELVSSVAEPNDGDDGRGPWYSVTHSRRSRARSADSPHSGRTMMYDARSSDSIKIEPVSTAPQHVAESPPAKRTDKHLQLVREARQAETLKPVLREESNSTGKGKAVDPRNWGSAQIPEEELDMEYQHHILEQYSPSHRQKADGEGNLRKGELQREALAHREGQRLGSEKLAVTRDNLRDVAKEGTTWTAKTSAALATTEEATLALQEDNLRLRAELAYLTGCLRGFQEMQVEPVVKPPKAKSILPGGLVDDAISSRMHPTDRSDTHYDELAGGARQRRLKPSAQIDPGSYLGVAFESLEPVSRGKPERVPRTSRLRRNRGD